MYLSLFCEKYCGCSYFQFLFVKGWFTMVIKLEVESDSEEQELNTNTTNRHHEEP